MVQEASQLDQLRQAHEAARLKAELCALERYLAAEDLSARHILHEAEYERVDRREFLYDTPGWGLGREYHQHIDQPQDRKDGACYPLFQTEQDLAFQRGLARWLTSADELGVGILENLINFTFGTGFTYTASPLDAKDDSARALAHAAQAAIDQFIDANGWEGDLEFEFATRTHRDGEAYLRLVDHGGIAEATLEEPSWITEPRNARDIEDYLGLVSLNWKFGVASDLGRPDKVRGYFVSRYSDPNDWDCVDALDMIHAKLNVDRGVKRGVNDFYCVFGRMEGGAKVLTNVTEGSAIQSAIALIREHAEGTSESGITAKVQAAAGFQKYVPQANGGTKLLNMRRFRPGTILDVVGSNYHPGPMGAPSGPNFIPVVQAILRAVGTRWQMPEYMVSGDASNANYSSTLIAGGPFDRATQRRQAFFKRHFAKLFWRVLAFAARAGRFAQWGVETVAELRAVIELAIEAPSIAIRNQLEDEQIRDSQQRAGILSPKTRAAQSNLDYEVEVNQGARPEVAAPTLPTVPVMEQADTAALAHRLLFGGYP